MNEDEELLSQLMNLLSEVIPLTKEARDSAENTFRVEIALARRSFQNHIKARDSEM